MRKGDGTKTTRVPFPSSESGAVLLELLIWHGALADLEQAATWAHGDLRLQTGIMLTYANCLQERPEQFRRWLLLLQRTFRQGWDVLTRTAVSTRVYQ
jgi:hypothetical protein